MSEYSVKPNDFFDRLITITVHVIFWIIVTFVLPIISLGLRLFVKKSQIKSDHTLETLQDS